MAFNERYRIARRRMIKQEFNYKSKKLFSTFFTGNSVYNSLPQCKDIHEVRNAGKKFIMLLNFDKLL